jgi:Ca2+-binding RTX toxin-like protein
MITTILNTNNAPMTIKVEQLVNGVYITLAEQQINGSKSLSLDFITQSINPVRASFVQTGTGFEVEALSYAHLKKVASTQVVFISNDNPDFGEGYRFGFNGQEKVDEIAGVGNHNTALFWEYDTRLGRRWNVDPIKKEYESVYSCFSDNPIHYHDILGDDKNKGSAKKKASPAPAPGPAAPAKPTLPQLKKYPPTAPGYKAPKSGPALVKNPNGSGTGWLAKDGDVWVPADHKGTHAPHWDRQHPNGTHTYVYPAMSSNVAKTAAVVTTAIVVYEIGKWAIAILGAPETGGASLLLLATP